jgi:glycosyltransferase involved in cell wall biosynthesis
MLKGDKTRVGIVYMLTHPGGVQSCVLSLIRGLNAQGIVPDILWDQKPCEDLLKDAAVDVRFVRLRFMIPSRWIVRLPASIRYLAWLANIIDGEKYRAKYDCIFSFYNGFRIPPGLSHLYYLSGPPLLPQLENVPQGLRGIPIRVFRLIYRKLLYRRFPAYEYHQDCRYVINSAYTSGLFLDAHGVEIPVVYPPINLAGRSFASNDLSGRDTLLFFSRIVDYKRPELVLELAIRHPKFRCVIMGGVTENRRRYLENLKSQALGKGEVVFIANPDDETVREEMARTRFYIFPAANEHFGMTTPEAIASGAVPFVHDSGGQREIVPDNRLRFTDMEFHEKFNNLLGFPDDVLEDIREALNVHVRQYSEQIYVSKMLHYSENSNL